MTDESDDVFNDEETKVEAVEKEETKVDSEKVEPKVEAIAEAEEKKEEPASPEDKDATIARLEKENTGLHKARDAARHKQAAPAKNKADPVTDPDGFATEMENQVFGRILNLTSNAMAAKHDDFTEKWDKFCDKFSYVGDDGNRILTDKVLYDEMRAAPDPAQFGYDAITKDDDYLDKTSPDYEKRMETKIRDNIVKEMKDKGLDALNLPDLTNAQASESNLDQLVSTDSEEGLWEDRKP